LYLGINEVSDVQVAVNKRLFAPHQARPNATQKNCTHSHYSIVNANDDHYFVTNNILSNRAANAIFTVALLAFQF